MSRSLSSTLPARLSGMLVWGFVLTPLAGCHHGSPAPTTPPAPEKVQVGYGEQSKEQTGGSVESLTDEELRNAKAAQAEEFLAGRFPGVEVVRTPGGGFLVRIRGTTTVLGNREPLYVVDGMPVEVTPGRGLDWLNPGEIKRIDVLKSPAETSMYGSRGANGVIVITTKRR